MKSFFLLTLSVFLLLNGKLSGQQAKVLEAVKLGKSLQIDGMLAESCWEEAPFASQFIQSEPLVGQSSTYDAEVRLLYDDRAIYIGARIYDPNPDSLSFEMGSRDNIGLADYFGVRIDPFNDGLNAFGFYVTTRGVQADMRISNSGNSDFDWDAVWKSSVSLIDDGWMVEMEIPFSALRFPSNGKNNWGINFARSIQRKREYAWWNPVDPKQGGVLNQSGELTGIDGMAPPLRLSGMPYFSTYANHNTENNRWNYAYNYGMDLKIGLNESFTLDLTLIPDFGHVESDELVYSLSPFEVYYGEKRPFFTEGMELFSKGSVFYSRRIGARPSGYATIRDEYEAQNIIENPENAQLINAAKLSGKTSGGLGVGVFNAMTANTYATVEDSSGKRERILTEPYTNFNMVIFDQALKNNSSISIYNTNVYKPENQTAANVSGTVFNLREKSNTYEVTGMLNVSQHYAADEPTITGQRFFGRIEKISGNFLMDGWFNLITDTYDPNDFGFQHRNNQIAQGFNFRYNEYEQRGNLLQSFSRMYINHYYHYVNTEFTILEMGGDFRATNLNHFTFGGNINYNPFGFRDFYEARAEWREFYRPPAYSLGVWWSPDYRKKFLIDYRFGIRHSNEYDQFNWKASISPRIRVGNSFLLKPELLLHYQLNDIGYVTDSTNNSNYCDIIFGSRDVKNITTSISADYVFSKKTSLAFRMRHYWLRVNYSEYFDLLENGRLSKNDYTSNEDFSVNAFNIDMVFKWDFAPGSELLLVWKNAVFNNTNGGHTVSSYTKNLQETFEAPMSNSFSIKLLYYLDWQYLKNLRPSSGQGSVTESYT